jgi:hypothetical protein
MRKITAAAPKETSDLPAKNLRKVALGAGTMLSMKSEFSST